MSTHFLLGKVSSSIRAVSRKWNSLTCRAWAILLWQTNVMKPKPPGKLLKNKDFSFSLFSQGRERGSGPKRQDCFLILKSLGNIFFLISTLLSKDEGNLFRSWLCIRAIDSTFDISMRRWSQLLLLLLLSGAAVTTTSKPLQ